MSTTFPTTAQITDDVAARPEGHRRRLSTRSPATPRSGPRSPAGRSSRCAPRPQPTSTPRSDAAAEAFLTWRDVPAPVRGQLVKRWGELLTEHKADLATLVTAEVGKITSEALGEVQEMIDICDLAVGQSRQLFGKTMPSERPGHRLAETWHPLGVVGVISAFNFPVAVYAWNTALALIAGDTVVWKPAEATPLTALATDALLARAVARGRCAGRPAPAACWATGRSARPWSRTPGWPWSPRPARCGWAARSPR